MVIVTEVVVAVVKESETAAGDSQQQPHDDQLPEIKICTSPTTTEFSNQ